MKFFKSALSLSALVVLASAMTMERNAAKHDGIAILSSESIASVASFGSIKSACDKADEDDCTEYCKLSEASATCKADGNKITCYCKGSAGGGPGEKCEERCLLCMPGKSALEQAKELFKLGGTRLEEL